MNGSINDVVLFAGSGSTAIIHKIISIMHLRERCCEQKQNVYVLLGPYEHHSNILPWKESGCHVLFIDENQGNEYGLNTKHLHSILQELLSLMTTSSTAAPDLIIGSFNACSNVTGILEDTISVTKILKTFDAKFIDSGWRVLSFWDYSACAPYVSIDMNPLNNMQGEYQKDAIFMSGHKFLGGIQTPGIAMVKKYVLSMTLNSYPSNPGGGTVFFVSQKSHRYLQNFEEREEGGTPMIIGSIRAALAFKVKNAIGIQTIEKLERNYFDLFVNELQQEIKSEQLCILGLKSNENAENRLPIISFLIRFGIDSKYYLHYNFVCMLMNDLFGIQSRGGCACAGPYSLKLLGIETQEIYSQIEKHLLNKLEIFRPGFTRINLHYTLTVNELHFIIKAVKFIVHHGYKFLPVYGYFVDTGEWRNRRNLKHINDRRSLGFIHFRDSMFNYKSEHKSLITDDHESEHKLNALMDEYINEAIKICNNLTAEYAQYLSDVTFTKEEEKYRWFVMPSEALMFIHNSTDDKFSIINKESYVTPELEKTKLDEYPPVLKSTHISWINFDFNFFGLSFIVFTILHLSLCIFGICEWQQLWFAWIAYLHLIVILFIFVSYDVLSFENMAYFKRRLSSIKHMFMKEEYAIENNNGCISLLSHLTENNIQSNDEIFSDLFRTKSKCGICYHYHRSNLAECLFCQCVDYRAIKESENDKQIINKSNANENKNKKNKKASKKVLKKLLHKIGKAIKDYEMIEDGDRILVGLSGGKDSLTLLYILQHLQRIAPVKFEIGACTVDPSHPEYNPLPLKEYLHSQNIPYFYEKEPIFETAQKCMDAKHISFCSFCSRMKRGILYGVCRRENYNVLALGQHLNDLCESFLMSAFFNGRLRTMKANYYSEDGKIRIIRPMVYVREEMTREFANINNLPIVNDNCPACYDAPQERQRMKLLLANQEALHSDLFHHLLKSIKPLMAMQNSKHDH